MVRFIGGRRGLQERGNVACMPFPVSTVFGGVFFMYLMVVWAMKYNTMGHWREE